MLKKVWFYIHGRTPEFTVKVMTKVLAKHKFIQVNLEENKCIISSNEVPDLNDWIINNLIESKRFLGKFHKDHPLHNQRKYNATLQRIQATLCRFGFWDCASYPEDAVFNDFLIKKTNYLIKKFPLWKAVKLAAQESGHELPDDPTTRYMKKIDYVNDLTRYHKVSAEQALLIIEKEFPEIAKAEKPKETAMTRAQMEKIRKKTEELIQTLRFYSPRGRKEYLDRGENFDKFIIFTSLFAKKGREWVIENIGEVESWT